MTLSDQLEAELNNEEVSKLAQLEHEPQAMRGYYYDAEECAEHQIL